LPYDPAKVGLARKDDTRRWSRLDEELVTFDSKVAPLLGAIPLFIPRDLDYGDEIVTLNPVSSAIREHRPVQRGSFGIARSCPAVFGN